LTELSTEPSTPDEIAVCLSGGGYRAMLYHLGALWRLNELGYLRRLDLVSAVSAGAILGAHLATRWTRLQFDAGGVAQNFPDVVVNPIRELAEDTIDVPSVISSFLSVTKSNAEPLAERLAKRLYGQTTLQDWPDRPRFVISATNVQCGSQFRFSKAHLADSKLGNVVAPKLLVATAVAASGAVPPVLSPMVLEFEPSAWTNRVPASDPRFHAAVQLTDGTLHDHYAIEAAWNRYRTILISDGGAGGYDDPEPPRSWVGQLPRLLDLLTYAARAMRRREIITALASGQRNGALWSITSRLENYSSAAIRAEAVNIEGLEAIPARYAHVDAVTQMRLINWGYASCDAAMRTYMGPIDAPTKLPMSVAVQR